MNPNPTKTETNRCAISCKKKVTFRTPEGLAVKRPPIMPWLSMMDVDNTIKCLSEVVGLLRAKRCRAISMSSAYTRYVLKWFPRRHQRRARVTGFEHERCMLPQKWVFSSGNMMKHIHSLFARLKSSKRSISIYFICDFKSLTLKGVGYESVEFFYTKTVEGLYCICI